VWFGVRVWGWMGVLVLVGVCVGVCVGERGRLGKWVCPCA
jgi:hypothetical protein